MSSNDNQGEGDRRSARRYNHDLREFITEGKVPEAAHRARDFVDAHPDQARRAEREARRGPRSWLQRTVDNLRAVFHRG